MHNIEHVTLESISKISSGGTPSRKIQKYWGGDIPWIKTTHIHNNIILRKDIDEWITIEGLKKSSAKIVSKGAILMAMYGQGKTRGKVSILGLDASINQACAAIEINSNAFNKYVYQQLIFRYELIRGLSNSGGQKNLSSGIIKKIKIPLPPLPEQAAIADLLATWDEAIEKTEKLIEAKEVKFKGLEQKLITQKVINKSWKKIKLGDVGKTYTGITGKSKKDFGTGKPYITYLNVFQNSRININQVDYVQIEISEKQNRVQKGDFFFTTSSETPNEVGMTSVLLDDMGECYINSFCFGWRPESDLLNNSFLQYYFRNDVFRNQVCRLAQGATRYNLSKIELMKTFIYYPDIETQNQISEILNMINDEINLLKTQLKKYKSQKRGLMQKLLTGVWRVKV